MNVNAGAIAEGLNRIGVGKRGSKSCPEDLVTALIAEFEQKQPDTLVFTAFYTSLFIKGIAPQEQELLRYIDAGAFDSAAALLDVLAPSLSGQIQEYALRVLSGAALSRSEARQLGEFLFDSTQKSIEADCGRVILAVALRMKHTEPVEYAGLLDAMHAVVAGEFQSTLQAAAPIIQFAEPFDGMMRGYIISPVLACVVHSMGFSPVHLSGESSGPKYGMTAKELLTALEVPSVQRTDEIAHTALPPFGCQVEQSVLAPPLHRWVDIRRKIIKRPFLATLEKLLNPWHSRVLVSSAFHLSYAEKMTDTFEHMGWNSMLTFYKTDEGGIGISTERESRCLATKRLSTGRYERRQFSFNPERSGVKTRSTPQSVPPDVGVNAGLISGYITDATSGDEYFDLRCRCAEKAFIQVLDWVLS